MEQIFQVIADEGEATVGDIYMCTDGMQVNTIIKYLARLVREGRIRFTVNGEGDRVYSLPKED